MSAETARFSPFCPPPELKPICENLTELVLEQVQNSSPFDGDPLYEQFFDNLARSLCRRSTRHAALRREKGIGDHAVLLEFARRVACGHFPSLGQKELLRVDARHVPVERAGELLQRLLGSIGPDNLLVIDGLGTLFSVGDTFRVRAAFTSFASLSPARLLCLLTPREFEEQLAGRGDCEELFSVVELAEPGQETAVRLVQHFAVGLSRQHGLKISEDAVRKSVTLSADFLTASRLPTKAVRLLSEACDDLSFDLLQGRAGPDTIGPDEVVRRVAAVSGLPESTIAGLPDGVDYSKLLANRVFGQEQVVAEVAMELSLIRAGMVDSGKPASVMLFVGQTGTGKTELAKAVAQLYSTSRKLKTFTLGNYSEPHSVSGIIGVPPGYVGHDQGGRLINELNADPYGVFLLDEADKAHPDVMQPFLNLFDEGWIVDQRGVKAYAERAIFILTTNVGQRQIAEMQKKGKEWQEIQDKLLESLSQIRHTKANRPVFSPEFLARLKKVVLFRSLDASAIELITRHQLHEMSLRWKQQRSKSLAIDPAVICAICQMAHERNQKSNGKEGGRIVRKLIAQAIETRLQEAIALNQAEYRACETISLKPAVEHPDCKVVVQFHK